MSSWRDVAAKVLDQPPAPPAAPVGRYGLDPELCDHLARLPGMPPPRKVEKAANWAAVVGDALRLAREGWASKALALGWSVHDLFGVGPRDSWEFEGLAVWLAGREVVLLDEQRAIAGAGRDRSIFVRSGMGHGTHPVVAPVLLWDFGRG